MSTAQWTTKALGAVQPVLMRALQARVFPGCVVGVVCRGHAPAVAAFGRLTYDSDSAAVVENTIYDAASLTKVLPTSTMALIGLEQGLFSLDTPVRLLVPELRHRRADAVLVRHLLTHTLDFGFRLSSLRDLAPRALFEAICSAELTAAPGERFFYSNATSILLGVLLERAFGDTLDSLAQRYLCGPMGIEEAYFGAVPEVYRGRTAPSERDPWRGGEVRGETHDETAWRLRPVITPGSAGLFVTMPGLLRFVSMMVNGGMAGERRILSEATLRSVGTNQIAAIGASTGLGWELNQPYMGVHAPDLVGKTGFTGCSLFVDIRRGQSVALLSNWTWPQRREGRVLIDQVRREVADAAYGQNLALS